MDGPLVVEVHSSTRPDLGIAEVSGSPSSGPTAPTEPIPVVAADDGTVTARRRPPQEVAIVLGLLGAVIVLWVSEIVPLFVTSLAIPVVLAVGEVGTAHEVLAPFFDPIIVLFFAGFVMAEAMRRVGLDRRPAVTIVATAGSGPVRLFAALLGRRPSCPCGCRTPRRSPC